MRRFIHKIFFWLIFFSLFNTSSGKEKIPQKKEVYGVVFLETMFFNIALNDAGAAIKVYMDELQNKFDVGFELKTVLFKNNDELLKSYSKENLAIINFSAVDYLKYWDKIGAKPMFVSTFKDSPYEEFLLLVKKDSGINTISQLSSEKIGMIPKEYNPLVYMWLKVLLSKNKVTSMQKILNNISDDKIDSQNIMAVFFGQLDACIVSKRAFQVMSELNPQVGKQLRILASSPGFIIAVSCYSDKFMKSPHQQKLYDVTLKASTDPSGQHLFTLLKIEKLIPFKEEYLKGVRNLLSEYNLLEKKAKQ